MIIDRGGRPPAPTAGSRGIRRGPARGRGVLAVLAALLIAGCAPSPSPSPSPSATGTEIVTRPPASATPQSPTPSTDTLPPTTVQPTEDAQPLAGRTIVVDPGHNGRYKKSFNTKQVPAGNGRKKACNSSGTSGRGLTEHAYNWAQAGLLKAELERLGATVLLTREDDSGLGPCVNLRAQVANDATADLLISIHADGSYSQKARGFHIIVSTTMAGGPKLEKASKQLALNARAELEEATKMPRSTYIGDGTALSPRSDIATLNLLERTPGIMMEMGNMRHDKDLKLMKSETFREQVAQALAEAAVTTLAS